MKFSSNRVLVFGGTGSLGHILVERFTKLKNEVVVFSRDEAKHHKLKMAYPSSDIVSVIGDVRDYDAVERAMRHWAPGVIINAAAMKQVPICETHPLEALKTNTIGTHNIVKAAEATATPGYPRKILSVSTDKACKPVNSYGMTKALQERIHLNGVGDVYNCVRYGNVLESTGSVIPVFKQMVKEGKTLKVTDERMTRFLMSLDQAVDLIFKALKDDVGGKIFIPKVPSAKMSDLAVIFGGDYYEITGIRPGEKLDEILISEEELVRTDDLGDIYVIHDINNWANTPYIENSLRGEYSSKMSLMSRYDLKTFLERHNVI